MASCWHENSIPDKIVVVIIIVIVAVVEVEEVVVVVVVVVVIVVSIIIFQNHCPLRTGYQMWTIKGTINAIT